MIHVLLVDDHDVVRFGLSMLISGEEDMQTVASASDGAEAVALALEHLPDVVVMDLSMPGMDGITAMRRIREVEPAIRMLVLTTHAREAIIREALAAGADGYLVKESGSEEIIDGIREVCAGGTPMSAAAQRVAGV